MDHFIVSARKYRPDTFSTVVGQGAITQTLKNAIRHNQLAQAYLFCGPRGVGKTTCARILAKILNCTNKTSEVEACNVCESCTAFNAARSYNIHELDAASNNSVEDIRSLIEQVRIPPQVGRYSIYIIDEVHMLSSSAFNAFLKTLEEPPPHAIFILATTEKHKIIPTILSRCQIFDFNRIQIKDTVNYLAGIAKQEGVTYEEEAFNMIAQKADGGMRDALSIFDQIVAFSGKSVSYKDVIENLNVLDYEHYFNLTEIFLAGNYAEALSVYDQIINQGFDPRNFINGLSSHVRDLLVCKEKAIVHLLEVGESIKERYIMQTANCEGAFLLEALNLISKADTEYNQSRNKRLHVELLLINLCNLAGKKKSPITPIVKDYTDSTTAPKADVEQNEANSMKSQHDEGSVSVQVKSPPPPPPTPKKSIKQVLQDEISILKGEEIRAEQQTHQNMEVEKTEDLSAEKKTEASALTEEKVSEGWNLFLSRIEHAKPRLHAVLSMSVPRIKEAGVLECTVANPMQREHLVRTKQDLIAKLIPVMECNDLDIVFVVDEQSQIPLVEGVLTNEEKLNRMAELNPSLIQMRKDFSLDFE